MIGRAALALLVVAPMLVAGCGDASDGRDNGSQCSDSAQCESGYCEISKAWQASLDRTLCGTCRLLGVSTGSACSITNPCMHGNSCVGSAAGGTCVAEAGLGEACDRTLATAPTCGPQLACNLNTCSGAGGICGSFTDGSRIECADGFVCYADSEGNICFKPTGTCP